MYEYTGNIHIHSSYSDGSLEIEDIAGRAHLAGLEFIIITDHHTLKGRYEEKEGYIRQVLVLIGMEANYKKNHYLCLDVEEEAAGNDEDPQQVIDEVNRQKGIGIIAHPFEKGSAVFENGAAYEWTDWQVTGFQGIEIWNFTSQWKDHVTSICKGLVLVFYPHAALPGPCPRALAKLDEYQRQGKKIFATGGSDAHGYTMKIGMLKVLVSPYEESFRCINVHVLTELPLTGEAQADRKAIYQAIRKGRLWVGYDYFINSRDFRFYMEAGGQRWQMGESVPLGRDLKARVLTSRAARVKLIRNGRKVADSSGLEHVFNCTDRGVYRVEVYHRYLLGHRPWIFSNSIWVD